MDLNELIAQVNLDIKRTLEYIKMNQEFDDFSIIIENNYKNILNEFNNQENKNKLYLKKYYVKLKIFYETEVLIIKNLLDNNYLLDNTSINLNQKLKDKIQEIESCIANFKQEYDDNKLLDYITKKYQYIINNYYYELEEAIKYKKTSLANMLKNKYTINLSLYTDINFIRQKYLNELTIILDDFVKYLNSLTENKQIINDKENYIYNKLELIDDKLKVTLLNEFMERKEEYNHCFDNINLEDLKIGHYQCEYIKYLISLENKIEIIELYIKNHNTILELEESIEKNINEINMYLKTNLKEEFEKIKLDYRNIISNYTAYEKNSIANQQEYLNRLKNFKEQFNSKNQICEYLNYLINTNPLLIRYQKIDEIKQYLIDNPNSKLEEALNRIMYLFLLFKIAYDKDVKFETLDRKDKLLIERFFFMDMNLVDKNSYDFYLNYLKNGLNTEIILDFINQVLDFDKNLLSTVHDDYAKMKKEFKGNWNNIEFRTINFDVFKDNESYIITEGNEIFKVNKNGSVVKIDFPYNLDNVSFQTWDKGILIFDYFNKGYIEKRVYITKDKMVEGEYFPHYSIISNGKYLVKENDDTFVIFDVNDQNYRKKISTKKIKNAININIIWNASYLSAISLISNMNDVIVHFINDFLVFSVQQIEDYIYYNINTGKLSIRNNVNEELYHVREDEEEIKNYSLLYNGIDYRFINLQRELDCPYLRFSIVDRQKAYNYNNNNSVNNKKEKKLKY